MRTASPFVYFEMFRAPILCASLASSDGSLILAMAPKSAAEHLTSRPASRFHAMRVLMRLLAATGALLLEAS